MYYANREGPVLHSNVCMLPDGQREHSSGDALFGKWFLFVAAFPIAMGSCGLH